MHANRRIPWVGPAIALAFWAGLMVGHHFWPTRTDGPSAYDAGRQAEDVGLGESANPYSMFSHQTERCDWQRGWIDSHREAQRRGQEENERRLKEMKKLKDDLMRRGEQPTDD